MESELIQAEHSMEFAGRHLQRALEHSTAVEAIILLGMIEDCAKLHAGITRLLEARVHA